MDNSIISIEEVQLKKINLIENKLIDLKFNIEINKNNKLFYELSSLKNMVMIGEEGHLFMEKSETIDLVLEYFSEILKYREEFLK